MVKKANGALSKFMYVTFVNLQFLLQNLDTEKFSGCVMEDISLLKPKNTSKIGKIRQTR